MDEDEQHGDGDIGSIMGFSGFGKKARTFDLEAIFEQTRRTAIERSQRILEERQKGSQMEEEGESSKSVKPSALSQEDKAAVRNRQSDSSSDSDSELVGPPVPPQHAAQEDKDELIGPPLPPGYRDSTANSDDDDEAETKDDDDSDDDDDDDEDDDNPVKKIPDTHEIILQHGTRTVSALGLDPSGARLVTGGYDYDVRFWDFAGMDQALQAFRTLQPCEWRQDQQQRGWTLQKGTLPEAERKDLRIWMRRKQRERLAAYQKQRRSLREREHKPFSASSTGRSPNRRQASSGRNREEKEKFMLLKQFYQRTEEAFSLARDALASPGTAPSSSQPCGPPGLPGTWSTSASAAPPGNPRRAVNVSANDKKSLRSQSGGSPPRLRYPAEGRPSEDLRKRLGLHRPGDRLSQVTRRGMLSNTKSQPKLHEANQSRAQHVGFQTKTGFNSSFSSGAALQRGNLREQGQVKQPEAVKRLDSTRLEDEEDFPLVLARTLDGQDAAVTGGASEMDWLDHLSDSPGSSLNRIDWAAIERLVAAEED